MPWLQERKIFDEKFIRLDTRRLCELTSAADALAMKPLVDLTSRALARLIEGKTPEQVRCRGTATLQSQSRAGLLHADLHSKKSLKQTGFCGMLAL